MATITTISESVGANRIVPTVAIPYPVGNPSLELAKETELRHTMVKNALDLLAAEVTEPPLIYSDELRKTQVIKAKVTEPELILS